MHLFRWWSVLVVIGCAGAPKATGPVNPAIMAPETDGAAATAADIPALDASCDAHQIEIVRQGDARATPWSTSQHLSKNFPDGEISWLMPEVSYQKYVVSTAAQNWGRCNATGCYVFAAPAALIHAAVAQSMHDGRHDPAALGKALGLPAANFEGPLRMMTLDLDSAAACARLPVDTDPGVWPCKTAGDTDCFKFGGYTSGGIPEIIVIGAPVAKTRIEEVQ